MTHPHWKTTPPPEETPILVCFSEFEDGFNTVTKGYISADDKLLHYEGINTTDPDNIKGWYPIPEFK